MVVAASTCAHCENVVAPHQGPRAARHYEFPVMQAAEALVMVGQGVSYTETADRMRVRSSRGRFDQGAQLIANWVEVLAPVVAAEWAVTSWPETVVCDSTWFDVTNSWTKTTTRAFNVHAVYGYDAGQATGRTLLLRATPTTTQHDWADTARSFPGTPAMVVCDNDGAIFPGVSSVWNGTFFKLCEHHLRELAIKRLRSYGHTSFGDQMMGLLNDAFKSLQGWQAFKNAATGVTLQQWINDYDGWITEQTRRRATLPQHHSTGAIDEVLSSVRTVMEQRAFCYRNAERTNRMLELVRLRLNRCDDPIRYAAAIRTFLDEHDGQLPRQGLVRDKLGVPSLR